MPHGFVLAHVGLPYGDTTVASSAAGACLPASSLISLQVSNKGSNVTVRVDGEALWLTPRSPYELVPSGTASARVTIYPEHGKKTAFS